MEAVGLVWVANLVLLGLLLAKGDHFWGTIFSSQKWSGGPTISAFYYYVMRAVEAGPVWVANSILLEPLLTKGNHFSNQKWSRGPV